MIFRGFKYPYLTCHIKISRCCCRVQMRVWTKTQRLAIYSWKLFHATIGHLCALLLSRVYIEHWQKKKRRVRKEGREKIKFANFFLFFSFFFFFETKREILTVDGLKLVWKFKKWGRNRTRCFRNNGTKVNWVSRT